MYRLSSLALIGVLILLATAGINATGTVYADLPPRPTVRATETPTPSPTRSPTLSPTTTSTEVPAATSTPSSVATVSPPSIPDAPYNPPVRIRLVAGALHNGSWSVVQWQGKDGVWHDVAGWQGTIERGVKQWRVAPRHYGHGPFRWVVWNQERTRVVAASHPFTLPDTETTPLIVELKPPD